MPLYEYQCRVCGVRFERRRHVSDKPVKVCPECGGEVQRLYQPVGIVFKGKGFYVTDHRGKSSTATLGKESSGEKKPAKESSNRESSNRESSNKESSNTESSNTESSKKSN